MAGSIAATGVQDMLTPRAGSEAGQSAAFHVPQGVGDLPLPVDAGHLQGLVGGPAAVVVRLQLQGRAVLAGRPERRYPQQCRGLAGGAVEAALVFVRVLHALDHRHQHQAIATQWPDDVGWRRGAVHAQAGNGRGDVLQRGGEHRACGARKGGADTAVERAGRKFRLRRDLGGHAEQGEAADRRDRQQQSDLDREHATLRRSRGLFMAAAEVVGGAAAAGGVDQAGLAQDLPGARLLVGLDDPDRGTRRGGVAVAEVASPPALVGAADGDPYLDAGLFEQACDLLDVLQPLAAEYLPHARSALRRHGARGRGIADHADQALLGGTGDQSSVAIVDLAPCQAPGSLGAGAVDRVQQPVVDPERTVEPKRVVQRGHLHVGLVVADAVREGRGAQQLEVTCIGEQRLVQARIVGHPVAQPEPDLLVRRALGWIELVTRVDMAELERPGAREPALYLGRQGRQDLVGYRGRRLDVLRWRDRRHRQLVLRPVLLLLERGGHEEDDLPVLDRGYAAHREAASVAGPVELVHDRRVDVARAQEVGVQRVRAAFRRQRQLGGRQGLPEHLPAEHVLGADVPALAPEQVVLEAFQGEQLDQLVDG